MGITLDQGRCGITPNTTSSKCVYVRCKGCFDTRGFVYIDRLHDYSGTILIKLVYMHVSNDADESNTPNC